MSKNLQKFKEKNLKKKKIEIRFLRNCLGKVCKCGHSLEDFGKISTTKIAPDHKRSL